VKRKQLLLAGALILATLLVSGIALAKDEGAQSPAAPAEALSNAASASLSTSFTYQGRLDQNGSPVNDTCDMSFRLYDAASMGTEVGSDFHASVPITDGLFTVTLDFGAGAFTGDRRWLEIKVDCEEDGIYADLGRQELTAAPYAVYARSAGALHTYPITTTAPVMGQVLKWDGSVWTPAIDDIGSGGACWSLTGNAGITPGTDFLGTIDGVSLTLAVSGTAALRIEPKDTTHNIIGGHISNTVSPWADGATIGGGGKSDAPNSATGDYATVGGGKGNQASNDYTTVSGGGDNTASANYATVGGGGANRATGQRSTIGGGSANVASGDYAAIPGGWGATASLYGQVAHASGQFSGPAGDAQASLYVLRNETFTATPTELYLDGSWRRLTVDSGHAYTFDILIVAQSNGGQSAGYSAQGVIENVAGTTSLVGTSTITATALGEDNAAWDVIVEADATNGALIIKVTGAAGTWVRWVASVRTVEISW
jgi:hypothetical protein